MRDAAAKRETTMRERLGNVLRPMVVGSLLAGAVAVGLGEMRRLGTYFRLERHVERLYIPASFP